MSFEAPKNKPVLLIGATIIILILLSYIPSGTKILGYEIKPFDLFMDVKPDSLLDYSSIIGGSNAVAEKKMNTDAASSKTGHATDLLSYRSAFASNISFSLIEKAFATSMLQPKEETFVSGGSFNGPETKDIALTGNLDQMKYFFDALKKVKSEKVRVAYYGDSGVEGDLITGDVRRNFQTRFGGVGVGFLSITSQDITFRNTTKMSFSDDWKTISVFTGNPNNIPLGINGFVSIPQSESWVKYETTSWFKYLKNFSTAKVFYTDAKSSSIKYSFDGGADKSASLQTGKGVKELDLNAPGDNASSIKITATAPQQAEFFGVSLESGNGVYVDNFPWRGNTGLGFRNIEESTMAQFDKLLHYNLIILHFGANEATFGSTDYNWYENQMVKIINNLKKAFPNTSILMIGVGDRSIKRGTRFITDPAVKILIKTQKEIASRTGIAFWNLFDAMGGDNSMDSWVHANPPLALMDYTHPTCRVLLKLPT